MLVIHYALRSRGWNVFSVTSHHIKWSFKDLFTIIQLKIREMVG